MENALVLADGMVADLRAKAENSGGALSARELYQLRETIKMVLDISKEERERSKGRRVEDLTEEQLQAIGLVGEEKGK